MKKYTVATAPRRVRLKWLKKAQAARRKNVLCRRRLGITGQRRAVAARGSFAPFAPLPAVRSFPEFYGHYDENEVGTNPKREPFQREIEAWEHKYVTPTGRYVGRDVFWLKKGDYVPVDKRYSTMLHAKAHGVKNPGSVSEIRAGDSVTIVNRFGQHHTGRAVMPSASGGWVLNLGGRYGTPGLADDRNIVRVRKQRRAVSRNPELLVVNNPVRRSTSMRRRRRNSPITARVGGKKRTWKGLVRKYGVKRAAKMWRKGKKFHGYSKKRCRNGRRRRSRNSWFGNRRGHRKAAYKGWRRRARKSRGSRRRRSSRRGPKSWKAFVRKYGVKKAAKLWRKSKRRGSKRRSSRRRRKN